MVKKRKKRTAKKDPAKGAASLGLASAAAGPEDGTPAPRDVDDDDPFAPSPDDEAGAGEDARGPESDAGEDAESADGPRDDADGRDEDDAEPDDRAARGAGRGAEDADLGAAAEPAATDQQSEDEEVDGAPVATQLGAARYVIFGFFASWMVGAYVASKTLQGVWSWFSRKEWFGRALPSVAALPHEGELMSRATISLFFGAIVAGVIVYVYYRKPDVRQWADEVAEQLGKVKWPTRKDVGNYTVVVLAVSAVMTVYLALLDRFWSFLTNLIYSSGV